MSFNLIPTPNFDKEVKRLSKKYWSLKDDLNLFKKQLIENPVLGRSLGYDCYKVRISIKSKGKGKSGGARIITFVRFIKKNIYLLTIYDKSEKETISITELKRLIIDAESI